MAASPQVLRLNKEMNILAPRLSAWVDQVSLPTPGTAASYTVPANVDTIFITYTAGLVYVQTDGKATNGGAAVTPAAGITNGTGSALVLNGDTHNVDPGQVLSFVGSAICFVLIGCQAAFVVG